MSTVLIACCGAKRTQPAPARYLYLSPLFRKSVAWAEMRGHAWAVLSALHGVVMPEHTVIPYDLTLADTPPEYRKTWDQRVHEGLIRLHLDPPYIVLAGQHYRGWMAGRNDCTVPMQGMGIGQQLGWLTQQLQQENV